MGAGGVVRAGFPAAMIGQKVKGRFTSTLHCITSGIIKLSRMQPTCDIYRGMSGLKLPATFLQPNAYNVRAGVEYGFMSATLERSVAEHYSKGPMDRPSVIMEMKMGMVNRGAFLGWLSQYPHEQEILLPPLSGLEVLDHHQHHDADGKTTLVYRMGLNINQRGMTIEQVLEVRKKQCLETADLVRKDFETEHWGKYGDIPVRHCPALSSQTSECVCVKLILRREFCHRTCPRSAGMRSSASASTSGGRTRRSLIRTFGSSTRWRRCCRSCPAAATSW
jgi:hypothetical protein